MHWFKKKEPFFENSLEDQIGDQRRVTDSKAVKQASSKIIDRENETFSTFTPALGPTFQGHQTCAHGQIAGVLQCRRYLLIIDAYLSIEI